MLRIFPPGRFHLTGARPCLFFLSASRRARQRMNLSHNPVIAGRRYYSSSSTIPEVISLDCIEVETIDCSSASVDAASGSSHAAHSSYTTTTTVLEYDDVDTLSSMRNTATSSSAPSSSSAHGPIYLDVDSVDSFARSRIINFIRRTSPSPKGSSSSSIFSVRHTQMDGVAVVVAACRLTLPEPHRSFEAEGIAESVKDAELLAAMHAERICDTLGVPLFRLPSMQQRHAESARAQGRYAPMPGDEMRPDGTPIPPPLRMVPSLRSASSWSGSPQPDSTQASEHFVLHTVSEAELVVKERRQASYGTNSAADGSCAMASHSQADSNGVAGEDTAWLQVYQDEVFYPWTTHDAIKNNNKANVTSSKAGEAAMFDPTENGMWQLVNTLSTRCSPTPEDALVLPCVYDPAAVERIKDYFLQRGMMMKDRVSHTHVVLPGFSTRMYVADLRLAEVQGVIARGKAQTPELATQLAAMHAELLLDALGIPLFPKDVERQARHARAVSDYGRWAPNPLTGETKVPESHDVLPLPIKQQVGGDDVWLDPQVLSRRANTRSDAERIISVLNDINVYCGDCVEVNPPEELLDEAVAILQKWQRTVARNPYPNLFVITRMGDYYRATTITPVAHAHGPRGGNAIGRSIKQAIQLCSLHAVDTLCSLGIPVLTTEQENANFLIARKHLGLVGPDSCRILPPPSNDDDSPPRAKRAPYLPAYIIEGQGKRWIPHVDDTLNIRELRVPEDFVVCGAATPDDVMQSIGNSAKVCVNNYLQHQDALRRKANMPRSPTYERWDKDSILRGGIAEKVMTWAESCPINFNASIYITGYGTQTSVHNIAYLRIPLPVKVAGSAAAPTPASGKKKKKKTNTADGANTQPDQTPQPIVVSDGQESAHVLAIGISLKKKDAERACYMHAAAVLLHHGEDVLLKYRHGLPRQGPSVAAADIVKLLEQPEPVSDSTTTTINNDPSSTPVAEKQSPLPPLPFMHGTMKVFLESERHYTPPRRRPPPGPFNPF